MSPPRSALSCPWANSISQVGTVGGKLLVDLPAESEAVGWWLPVALRPQQISDRPTVVQPTSTSRTSNPTGVATESSRPSGAVSDTGGLHRPQVCRFLRVRGDRHDQDTVLVNPGDHSKSGDFTAVVRSTQPP